MSRQRRKPQLASTWIENYREYCFRCLRGKCRRDLKQVYNDLATMPIPPGTPETLIHEVRTRHRIMRECAWIMLWPGGRSKRGAIRRRLRRQQRGYAHK